MIEYDNIEQYSCEFDYGGARIKVRYRQYTYEYANSNPEGIDGGWCEVGYVHPMTGDECDSYIYAMQGWSEAREEDRADWRMLDEAIYALGEDLSNIIIKNDGCIVDLKNKAI